MTTKPPPVPPANQSGKGPGSAPEVPVSSAPKGSAQTKNPDKVGQAGNSKVNTTHQGHQQDR